MRLSIPFFILLLVINSCKKVTKNTVEYPLHVGDITFDPSLDDPDFKICNSEVVLQYYDFGKGVQYKGEKPTINEAFKNEFEGMEMNDETGFLTIRFIVNCEGKTGCFRVQGMDKEYREKKFNSELVNKLLLITRNLDGWIIKGDETNKFDYYQYLTFKLVNGQLIEIMP